MVGRRRALLLALLALAAPLPALATDDQALQPVGANGPVPLSVSTSLDSCGVLDQGVVCKLDVSYNALPNATSYSATVTRADGSVVDYGSVAAGGTSLWVPYVGSGTYSVRVTAYGTPDEPKEEKPVITTEVSTTDAEAETDEAESTAEASSRGAEAVDTQAASRGEGAPEAVTGEAESTVEATPNCTETAPPPAPVEPTPLPEPPPEDLDPENPDEDADGVLDDQERQSYDAAVAEQQAAEAVAQVPESIDC